MFMTYYAGRILKDPPRSTTPARTEHTRTNHPAASYQNHAPGRKMHARHYYRKGRTRLSCPTCECRSFSINLRASAPWDSPAFKDWTMFSSLQPSPVSNIPCVVGFSLGLKVRKLWKDSSFHSFNCENKRCQRISSLWGYWRSVPAI